MDTHEALHSYDNFALDMVNIKAAELVGTAGYTAEDFEDIRQDMQLDLIRRLKKFDPRKSNFKLFVTCVVDRKRCNLIRYRESQKRDYRREDCSLNEDIASPDSSVPVERMTTVDSDDQEIRRGKFRRMSSERTQMRMDVESVIAGLDPDQREAAELLQTHSIAAAAREMGMARTTFRDKYLTVLRDVFTSTGLAFYVR